MAKGNTTPIAIAIIALGGGVWYYLSTQKDKTPVGLVVTNAIGDGRIIGENADGTKLTAGAVEGTWRADEDSLSVISESAEKPLLVIYEDGTPVHAEAITLADYNFEAEPEECEGETDVSDACRDALLKASNEVMERYRKLAKEHGATEESIEEMFPTQESTQSQAAESIFGPMLSLQSHFVW
jgi:hypothetical protein